MPMLRSSRVHRAMFLIPTPRLQAQQLEDLTMKRRIVGIGFAAAAAVAAICLTAPSAFADTVISGSYPVSGTTSIAATNSSLTLGPGTLSATADLTTGTLTGSITLPPATGSFTELGIVPVTVTTEFIQDGQTTGTINLDTGAISATSQITLKITNLKVAGLDVPVGPACQSAFPASITITSGSTFGILTGGPVSGTYTIPPFANCLLETPILNLVIPGPGNTLSLTLGTPTFSS
jgi:hypothetical protein